MVYALLILVGLIGSVHILKKRAQRVQWREIQERDEARRMARKIVF